MARELNRLVGAGRADVYDHRHAAGRNLDGAPGTQSISDIEGQIANAQTAMTSAQTRHAQTSTVLTNFLQSIEGVNDTQVGTQILALQMQLQASLQTTALLSKVSIVNYITG